MSIEIARKRVQAGATFLDTIDPTWVAKVTLSDFDITNGSKCILGWVFGDGKWIVKYHKNGYSTGVSKYSLSFKRCIDMGFNDSLNSNVQELQEAWIELIKQRRAI